MSCLFNSLSYLLHFPGGSAALRSAVCDYLAKNPTFSDLDAATHIKIESGLDLDSYVTRMRLPSTWGGAIEIRAVCELQTVNVNVRVAKDNRVIEFTCGVEGVKTHAVLWTGGHYTADCPNPPPRIPTVAQRSIRPRVLNAAAFLNYASGSLNQR